MPDQPTDRNQPRPPRKGKPAPPRPSRQRDADAPARPPRHRDEAATSRPPRAEQGKRRTGKAGNEQHGSARPPRQREQGGSVARLSEGALYSQYRNDAHWPTIREVASRALVIMSRLLLQGLSASGWQVVANRRTDAPEYTFGFDNVWTLRQTNGSREVEFSPEQSYRDLLYIANPHELGAEPELDRHAITSPTTLEQKANIIARRAVEALNAS